MAGYVAAATVVVLVVVVVTVVVVIVLVLVVLAHMMRMTRAAILNVMQSAYIETAELKGLSPMRVIWQHAFPNAIAPIVSVVVLNLAYLVVFTATGGQTLGKMATGVRVEGPDGTLTAGTAALRVVGAVAGGLVAGVG